MIEYRKKNKDKMKEIASRHHKTEKRQNYLKNYSCLGKPLSVKQQIINDLYFKDHLLYKEIAERLNMTANCVSGHLHKIKQKLGLVKNNKGN